MWWLTDDGAWHVFASLLLAVLGLLSLIRGWCIFFSGTVAVLADFYLVILLLEASQRSKNKKKWCFEFPHKFLSLFLVSFVLVALVCSFGEMYLKSCEVQDLSSTPSKHLRCRLTAAYFSAVTITTLGYGDYRPTGPRARGLVLWELGSGALLLLVAFPIVASRLASFDDTDPGHVLPPRCPKKQV